MKLLFELLVIALFFTLYQTLGIYAAILSIMLAYSGKMIYQWIKHEPITRFQWFTFAVLIVFGGITLLLQNELFFKWKPTIVYWVLAVALGLGTLFSKKSILDHLSGHVLALPPLLWRRLDMAWFIFFVVMGLLNLWVAYGFSTSVWVYFKLFGMTAILMAFIIVQAILLRAYLPGDKDNEKPKSDLPHE